MRKVTYSMSVSLDGYVKGPDGEFGWSVPTPELHQFHNDQVRELGVHLLGRRLYETMVYWDTADPAWGEVERDFARVWTRLPKIVFSTTLTEVGENARLADGDPAAVVRELKEQPGGDIGVGGPGLAAQLIEADLVDDYRLFVIPVIVGGGTPYFPAHAKQFDLELVETRQFDSPALYLRYRRVSGA